MCGYVGKGVTTCELYTPGAGWRLEPYNLEDGRYDHKSWTLSNGSVVLLGGEGGYFLTTEIVTPGVGTRPGFSHQYLST